MLLVTRVLVALSLATPLLASAQQIDVRSLAVRQILARAPADSFPVWIFFDRAAAASTAPAAIGPAALSQRMDLGIPDLANDRPLPRALLDAVQATGAHIREHSRWLRAVSAWVDSASAERLARLPAVRRIQLVGDMTLPHPDGGGYPPAAAAGRMDGITAPASPFADPCAAQQPVDSAFFGPNWYTLLQLDIPPAQVVGLTGKGVRIAILDTGFETRHEALTTRQVLATRDFINGDSIVYNNNLPADTIGYDQSHHGTEVWSVLGGCMPGRVVGPAYDATFLLAKTEDEPNDTKADEDRWVAAVEWADSLGARIISSSLAYRFVFVDQPPIPYEALNGDSTITTKIADEAARRGILVVNAMGNDGEKGAGSLSAPADADSIIAAGAVDALGSPTSFTSRGPTADGRIKPDLSARGLGIYGASDVALNAYASGLAGTSFATPLLAASAAMFMQAWPDLSAMAVRAALIRSANHATTPDNAVGYGIPDVAAAILFPEGLHTSSVATVDLSGNLTTVAPTFRWDASLIQSAMRPIRYNLQIATDPVFDNVIYTDTVSESFSLTTRIALQPRPAIWWRVVAHSLSGAQRASAAAGPLSMPHWVQLLSPDPDHASFVETPRPDLSWTPLTAPAPVGPFVYDVEVFSPETGQLVQPTIRNVTASKVRVSQPLAYNIAYRWRVIARTMSGAADTVESVAPFVVTSNTQPPATLLYQNFPNPFPRPDLGMTTTRIWFDLSARSVVELAVYDLRGRLVRRLVPATPGCGPVTLDAGLFGRFGGAVQEDPCVNTIWDGRDEAGRLMPRGVYILRLRANGKDQVRRMLFVPNS